MSQRLQSRTIFQSTLPARGATEQRRGNTSVLLISIHAPRTGSDLRGGRVMLVIPISIHAPRTGSDVAFLSVENLLLNFNPRSPHGERQAHKKRAHRAKYFNPRSPHGERPRAAKGAGRPANFNPRSPHGERPSPMRWKPCPRAFQSTLPARGATPLESLASNDNDISIHAPRTGSDHTIDEKIISALEFQSTLPARGATGCNFNRRESRCGFQSTLPARGATTQ